MSIKNYATLLLLVGLCLLAGVSCGKNHQPRENDGGQVLEPGAGLPTSENPEEAVVDALINVLDYQIIEDPADPRVGSADGAGGDVGPAPGGSGMQIMAKIIQPGDDILSEVIATPGIRFQMRIGGNRVSSMTPLNTALQVQFKVAEDLDGDSVGGDTITQTVPVSIIAGRISRVDLTIRRASDDQVSPGSAPDAGTGELVYTAAERDDALGAKEDFFGTNYATGEVTFDVDGNEFLDQGDDQVLADENMNGWPDATEDPYFDPLINQPSAPTGLASGMIIAVDLAGYGFDLQTDDGRNLHVLIDPYALIAPLGPDGELLGQVVLDPSMVGRHVLVDGIPLDDNTLIALRVVLEDSSQIR